MKDAADVGQAHRSLGNGHIGVVDTGDATAALLSARLRRRGHLVTRLVTNQISGPQRVVSADEQRRLWTGDAMPADLSAVVPTGNRRHLDQVRKAAALTPLLAATAQIDLADELALLNWLGDHDVDVPRMLGASTRPSDLRDALPTDGPVVLGHSLGDAKFVRRRCADRRALETAVLHAESQCSEDDPGTSGRWYLSADVGPDDAVVAGIYRAGQPVVWGARAVPRDRFGRPLRIGPTLAADRLFELVEDTAEQLVLDGPAEFQFVVSGSEVALVGVTPVITWSMLDLGAGADDAIAAAFAGLGLPCAARPPSSPETPMPQSWRPVAPHRAWSSDTRLRRASFALIDPWRLGRDTPSTYRRWASAAGRDADPLVNAFERRESRPPGQ